MIPIQPLPFDASLEHYAKQANELVAIYQSGNEQQIRQFQDQLNFRTWPDTDDPIAEFTEITARQNIARLYGFGNWEALTTYTSAICKQQAAWLFESAIEAIIRGNITQLEALLFNNPALVQMRSMRIHKATLLHYLGANGIENYRQKVPGNAVSIAQILLNAGAAVDTLADIYGKSTTLTLVATSIHPWQTGIQTSLLETLLTYGASVDGIPGSGSPLQAALANGQPEAALALAQHGARIDNIVTAAGLGRLDLVQYFFCRDNLLPSDHTSIPPWGIPENPQTQAERALHYACLYGHTAVAEFLLAHDVDTKTGMTVATVNSFSDY
ncbi:hypothetical protein WBJ53_22355 [Spirosoma sp. SC4-14]|uniref:hypothetical protein n=1 Tax=Spirosoma sp. SC4-14 TaxID=3128900 RepID=UPI0030CB1990